MATYIFYVYSGRRGTARAVHRVEREEWVDWLDMKAQLREAMVSAYLSSGITEALIAVDKQKLEPRRPAFLGYRLIEVGYKREHMGFFKIEFNPKTGNIRVKQALMAGDLRRLIDDFYALEKGIKYRTPPLIPKTHKSILTNPHLIPLLEGGARFNSYIPVQKKKYSIHEPKSEYARGKKHYSYIRGVPS